MKASGMESSRKGKKKSPKPRQKVLSQPPPSASAASVDHESVRADSPTVADTPTTPAQAMTSEIIATTPADALKSVVDIQQDFEVRTLSFFFNAKKYFASEIRFVFYRMLHKLKRPTALRRNKQRARKSRSRKEQRKIPNRKPTPDRDTVERSPCPTPRSSVTSR